MQFFVSNFIGPELTDILSSLTCIIVMVAGAEVLEAADDHAARGRQADATLAPKHALRRARSSWRGCRTCCWSSSCWRGARPSIKPAIDRFDQRPAAGLSAARSRRWLNGLNVPGLHNLITRIPPVTPTPAPYAARVHVQLAERVGHGVLPGDGRRGARAARQPSQFVDDLRGDVQAAEDRDADDRVDARAGLPDELLGHDLDARPRAGGDRRRVPVLQRRASAGSACS